MKKLYILSIIIGSYLTINAQNYQTVSSGRIVYFQEPHNYISVLRIDSVGYDIDSIYYPMNNIRELETQYECYTPYGSSWMGRKIIVNDSINTFINMEYDSIKILPSAKLHESWTAYFSEDSVSAVATVIAHDTLSFLGLSDSVKTISFRLYDKSMKRITLNSDSIVKLSRSHGFIQTYNFYLFPDQHDLSESLTSFKIAGLSNPCVGIQNLTWLKVYDFQPGDIFHSIYNDNWWGEYNMIKNIIDRYLTRTESNGCIAYLFEREANTITYRPNSGTTYSYNIDTIQRTYCEDSIFNMLPGEPVINEYEAYTYVMKGSSTKIAPSEFSKIRSGSDSCWSNCCVDGCYPSYTYIKGQGGPYYWCSDWGATLSNELVYYKKGDEVWGTPLTITATKDKEIEKIFDLWPNPAVNSINLEYSLPHESLSFELSDISGQVVLLEEINSMEARIMLREEWEGIYIYRIYTEDEIMKTGKLIIE